jgi:RNA polymerase sigma-70 factor (ECF subfamily)
MIELEAHIIRDALKGKESAFKQMYDHYGLFIWKVIFRTVNGDSELAREAFQETLIKVYRQGKHFKFKAAFSTWLYRIAYNTTLTQLSGQQRYRLRNVEITDQNAQSSDEHDSQEAEVNQILSRMEPGERFLITAREITGLSYDELAEITGRSASALRTQLHRLKTTIQKEWAPQL